MTVREKHIGASSDVVLLEWCPAAAQFLCKFTRLRKKKKTFKSIEHLAEASFSLFISSWSLLISTARGNLKMCGREFRLRNFKFWHPIYREFCESRVSFVSCKVPLILGALFKTMHLGKKTSSWSISHKTRDFWVRKWKDHKLYCLQSIFIDNGTVIRYRNLSCTDFVYLIST